MWQRLPGNHETPLSSSQAQGWTTFPSLPCRRCDHVTESWPMECQGKSFTTSKFGP